ncbi:hypothetical protein ACC681_38150, partial [Rhizobium ruizarguesonis]
YTLAIEGYVSNPDSPLDLAFAIQKVTDTTPAPIPSSGDGPGADLVVDDIAVSPPTGWRPGDAVNLTWTVSNTGTLPAGNAWADQIRIRNLSTGQT